MTRPPQYRRAPAGRGTRRSLTWVTGTVLVSVLGAGCTGSDGRPVRFPPTTLDDCGKAGDPGRSDGGAVAGLALPSGEQALRTPAQAYLCLGSFAGSVVTVVQSGSPLVLEPAKFTVPEGGGVLPITVTATAAGTTTLSLTVGTTPGRTPPFRTLARVVAANERWHFERPD